MKKSDSFGKLFGESWDTFSAKFGILISLGALFSFLPSIIFEIWNSGRTSHIIQGVAPSVGDVLMELQELSPWIIFSWIFYTFFSVSIIYFLNTESKKKTADFVSTIKGGWTFYGRGLLLSILVLLFLIPLYLLLIVPGIIFQVYWMFALYILIVNNSSVMESLKKSYALVKGRWWKVFGYMILFYIIVGIVGAVFGEILGAFGSAGIFLQVALSSLIGILTLVFVNGFYLSLRK